MTEPNAIEQAITEHWGDRCPDVAEGCPCCEAWAQYDALTALRAERERLRVENVRRNDVIQKERSRGNRYEGEVNRLQGELNGMEVRAEAAEARVAELKKVLEPFAKAPSRGLYGGPMVQAILTYEDSTDENTARHRGRIGPDAFRAARAALSEGEQ